MPHEQDVEDIVVSYKIIEDLLKQNFVVLKYPMNT